MENCGNVYVCKQRYREKVGWLKGLDGREEWGKNDNRGRFQCQNRERKKMDSRGRSGKRKKGRTSKDIRVNKEGKINTIY